MSISVIVGRSGSNVSLHVQTTTPPPMGAVIFYEVNSTSTSLTWLLDIGGGTQNNVYIGIASGPAGTPTQFAENLPGSKLMLFHFPQGNSAFTQVGPSLWESGSVGISAVPTATISASAKIFQPAV